MSEDPVALLRELAAHLAYDAGVNGSKFTARPFGKVSLSTAKPDHLWARILAAAGLESTDDAETAAFQPIRDAINKRLMPSTEEEAEGVKLDHLP